MRGAPWWEILAGKAPYGSLEEAELNGLPQQLYIYIQRQWYRELKNSLCKTLQRQVDRALEPSYMLETNFRCGSDLFDHIMSLVIVDKDKGERAREYLKNQKLCVGGDYEDHATSWADKYFEILSHDPTLAYPPERQVEQFLKSLPSDDAQWVYAKSSIKGQPEGATLQGVITFFTNWTKSELDDDKRYSPRRRGDSRGETRDIRALAVETSAIQAKILKMLPSQLRKNTAKAFATLNDEQFGANKAAGKFPKKGNRKDLAVEIVDGYIDDDDVDDDVDEIAFMARDSGVYSTTEQFSTTNPTTAGSFYFNDDDEDDDEDDDPEEQCTPDTVDDDGVDDDSEGQYVPDTVDDDGLAAADDRAQDDFDDEDVDDDDVD